MNKRFRMFFLMFCFLPALSLVFSFPLQAEEEPVLEENQTPAETAKPKQEEKKAKVSEKKKKNDSKKSSKIAEDKKPADKKKDEKTTQIQGFLSDLEKVEKSLEIVKSEIDQTREKRFMPTLLMRQAELYVEKARLLFYKAKEETPETQKGAGVESPEIKEVKDLAIETYKKILSDFPENPDNPKVLFFMAHEMRETGDLEGMVAQYEKIARDYPESKYRGEALLLLGDHNFDHRKIGSAAKYYKDIIDSNLEGNITSMARYKLAWCYLNQDNYQDALKQFEDIAKESKKQKRDLTEERLGKSTIVREALIDSILCFTEIKKPAEAVDYYKDLADSEITYAKILEKLANRYFIKKDLVNATRLYRELLRISGELDDNIEYMKRVLQYSRDVNNREQSVQDIDFLIRNLNRYLHSFRVNDEDKRNAYNQFEVYARDIATKLHLKADETKKAEYYDASAKAYKQYLTLFKDSKYSKDIQYNFAETLYSSKKYLEAGEQYETLYKNTENKKEKSDALYSAVTAYFDAIKDPKSLDKVQLIDARQGFIKTAKQYIEEFPSSERTPELRFAIGRTHYDLEEYDEAIQFFVKFINDYPNHKLSVEAGNIVLDCYNIRKDYAGMVNQGKLFLANPKIKDKKFRERLEDVVKKTEFVMIQEQAGKGKLAEEQGDFAKDFLEYSQKYRGSELGEKALYNAFQSYRKKGNKKLTFVSGTQFLIQYPNSEYAKDVYPTLGSIAYEIADYDRACYYFESFQRKFPEDPKAVELLGKAGQIRTFLSDSREAISDFQKLLDSGKARDPKEIYMKMAVNYERLENWSSMASSLNQAVSLGEDTVEANAKLAYAYFRSRNFQSSRESISQALKTAGSKGSSRLSGDELSAVAQAQFLLVEMKYVDFENITLGKGTTNEGKLVEKKNRLLQDMEKSLTDISGLRDTKWIIATIFRIGQANSNFAEFLSRTSVPGSLNADQKKEYRKILSQKAALLKKKSKETLDTAISKAYNLNVFNNWVKSCYKGYYVKEELKTRQYVQLSPADKREIEAGYTELLSDPNDTKALNKIALLYMRNGDFGMAKTILVRATELRSAEASSFNNLGVASWYLGEDQEAYSGFAKAITINPNYVTSKVNLAALYYDYGNIQAAQSSVKKLSGVDKVNFNSVNVIPPAKRLIVR